jgi:hypothetical protein
MSLPDQVEWHWRYVGLCQISSATRSDPAKHLLLQVVPQLDGVLSSIER